MAIDLRSKGPANACFVVGWDRAVLLGRTLMAYLFVPEGIERMMDVARATGIGSVASPRIPPLHESISMGIEIAFGLALLFGIRPRWTGLVLAGFSVISALFCHRFWAVPEAQYTLQKLLFDHDMAIAGGLLIFASIRSDPVG